MTSKPTKIEREILTALSANGGRLRKEDIIRLTGRNPGYLGNAPISNPVRHAVFRLEERGLVRLTTETGGPAHAGIPSRHFVILSTL